MINTGIILTLAYPETIVMHAEEWYSPLLKYIGIGNDTHVRAGHAALVLIDKATGELEYHDFGRYITSEPNGRVRGKDTDHELDFPLKAKIESHAINNLDEILKFLATNPKLTHGEGTLIASVCNAVDYNKAKDHIKNMQEQHFIRYAAFIKEACNCARFVTDTLINSVTDRNIVKQLKRSKRFTPSTIGNVAIADTENHVYEVTEEGYVSKFNTSIRVANRRYFLDRLKDHIPNTVGTIHPSDVAHREIHAQWLEGIAAGAWFELHDTNISGEYRFRRISPYGNIDVDGLYVVNDSSFNYHELYTFVHYSNCHFFHVEQNEQIFRFDFIKKL